MWKWISRVIIILAVLLLTVQIADRLSRRGHSLPPVPDPNGYDILLTVSRQVTAPPGDLDDLGNETIRQIARTNREPMDRLHLAVRIQTGVPLRIEPGWVEKHAEDVKQLKRLVVILGLQSRAALLDGSTNGSAGYLLDTILLGHAMARGGVLSDGINSLVFETIGAAVLRAQVPGLDAATARAIAQELERMEALREKPEKILKTEKDWATASFGLVNRIGGLLVYKTEAQRRAQFLERYYETMRRTRRLMLVLAAHAVELETGNRMVNPSSLVPGVLKSVPLDPERNTPMTEIPGAINPP